MFCSKLPCETSQYFQARLAKIALVCKVTMCVCVWLGYFNNQQVVWCGMIWTYYNWLKKFYNFYMAAVVSITSRHGFRIEVYHGNKYKTKLVCIRCYFHFKNSCTQVIRWSTPVIRYVRRCDIGISKHLQEELA